jgi:hypothetical protein
MVLSLLLAGQRKKCKIHSIVKIRVVFDPKPFKTPAASQTGGGVQDGSAVSGKHCGTFDEWLLRHG